jgi:tetratricopeptide (TPR) repeat protein
VTPLGPRPALVLALLAVLAPAGAGAGRDALEKLRAGDAAGAEARFREGLAEAEADVPDTPADVDVRAALWNDLGLALLVQNKPAEAAEAFDRAAGWAAADSARALAAYNAGTALARAERWAPARDRLVRALLLRPAYPEARHNLEVVLRRLPRTPSPPDGARPEPSAFARRLKAQADSLVAARRYAEALALLQDGLRRDSTVAAYDEAIRRLDAVAGIVRGDTTRAGPPR